MWVYVCTHVDGRILCWQCRKATRGRVRTPKAARNTQTALGQILREALWECDASSHRFDDFDITVIHELHLELPVRYYCLIGRE